MATASFLGPFVKLQKQVASTSTSAANFSPGPGKLPFTIQSQGTKANWCWAAVAASITEYYASIDHTPVSTQEELASHYVEGDDSPADLATVLDDLGHRDGSPAGGAMLFPDILSNIRASRPICCKIVYDSGDHYVVIAGCYDDDSQDVAVCDPAGLHTGTFPYRQFNENLQGEWSDSYCTK